MEGKIMTFKKVKLWKKEKAAIYIRVSTAYQVDKDSLPLQRKMCQSYCEMHGLDYVIFEDAGFTAKTEKRPAYQEMIQRFRNGEFSHLIVYKLDRISRNLLDFMGMYEELESLYVTFISLNENFDTNTAMGKAMLAIMIIFAQMEREIDSERVLSVMIGRAENDREEVNDGRGLWNGAQTPFGFKFDYDIKYPVPDENELPTLHLIYDMYEIKRSTLVVARYLNSHSIPSKRGGKWTSKVVGDIIKNRFNIGEYSYNKRESGRGPYKPEDEWVIRPNNHPAVIDLDQFERCNKIISRNKQAKPKKNIKYVHIFQGIMKCHACGSGTSCSKDKRRKNGIFPSVYACTLRRTDLDAGCPNSSYISDYIIGRFVFSFVMNYYKAYKQFRGISKAADPLKDLSNCLLQGTEFHGISLKNETLKQIFNVLMKSSNIRDKEYYPLASTDSGVDQINVESIKMKQNELQKCDLAIQRLTDLYLFNEGSFSKENFLEKKQELENKKKSIEAELKSAAKEQGDISTAPSIDKKQFSALFLKIGISDDSYDINFVDIYHNVDHQIIKDFVSAIIKTIEYENARIFSIEFVNGLKCDFNHKSQTDIKCPVCGSTIWHTVSCRKRTLPINGKIYQRIKMGDPKDYYHDKENQVCEDCGVSKGRWHHYGCKKERCPICGKPLYKCEHSKKVDLDSIKKS